MQRLLQAAAAFHAAPQEISARVTNPPRLLAYTGATIEGISVAKANYKFDKRQRELAQQKKRDEKLAKKAAKKAAEGGSPEQDATPPGDGMVPH